MRRSQTRPPATRAVPRANPGCVRADARMRPIGTQMAEAEEAPPASPPRKLAWADTFGRDSGKESQTRLSELHKRARNTIRLTEIPAALADALRVFDYDGDGTIDPDELRTGATRHEASVAKHHFYRRMFVALFVLFVALLAAQVGVVYGVVGWQKESHVSEDGTMTTKDGLYAVRTATATLSVPLSSSLSDDAFLELRTISLTSPTGNTMHLTTLGFIREPAYGIDGRVTIITHIGRVVLTGTELSYVDDMQAALFQSAGFGVELTSRRLLQVRALMGVFNAVAAITATSSANVSAVPGAGYVPPPPRLPDQFIMGARRLSPCITFPNEPVVPSANASYTGGQLPLELNVDICDLLQIDPGLLHYTFYDDGSVNQRYLGINYTMFRLGNELLRVEYAHPAVPGFILVEVLDATEAVPQQFAYQVAADDKGIGLAQHGEEEVPVLAGPVFYYNTTNLTSSDLVGDALGAPYDYLGNTTLGSDDVRIWAFHLRNNSLHIFWYDTFATQEVKRIDMGPLGMLDVDFVIPLDGDAVSNWPLFMAPVAGTTVFADNNTQAAKPPVARITIDPWQPYVDLLSSQVVTSPAPPTPPQPPNPPSPPMPGAPSGRRLLAPSTNKPVVAARRRDLSQLSVELSEWRAAVMTGSRALLSNATTARRRLLQLPIGCASNNKCPVQSKLYGSGAGDWKNTAVQFAYPGVPFGFAFGPAQKPCMYQFSADCPEFICGTPTIPVSISGAIDLGLCADQKNFDYVAGTVSLSFGLGDDAATLLQFLSWNIVSITAAIVTDQQDNTCLINSAGYASDDLLSNMYNALGSSVASNRCDCLAALKFKQGAQITVQGPDIPGIYLSSVPPLAFILTASGILPFLAFTNLQTFVTYTLWPYVCNLQRNDVQLKLALSINLVFFSNSITLFAPAWQFMHDLPSNTKIGQLDPGFNGPSEVTDAVLDGLMKAVALLGKKLQQLAISWADIKALGGKLADAATTYFNSGVADTNKALAAVFAPSRIVVAGCFNSITSPVSCLARTRRVRIFGKRVGGVCYMWSPAITHCGATAKCSNCPARPPPPPAAVTFARGNCAKDNFPDNVPYILGAYGLLPWGYRWGSPTAPLYLPNTPGVSPWIKASANYYWAQPWNNGACCRGDGAGSIYWYTSIFAASATTIKLDFIADGEGWAYLNDQMLVGDQDWRVWNTKTLTMPQGSYNVLSFKTQNSGGEAGFMAVISQFGAGGMVPDGTIIRSTSAAELARQVVLVERRVPWRPEQQRRAAGLHRLR